jgi:thiol:disulfide interchange protein DsbC
MPSVPGPFTNHEADMSLRQKLSVAAACSALLASASADEATIRKNLSTRLPNLPRIDSVLPSAVKGLWEIRLGSELIYSDDSGSFVIEGTIIDTQRHLNITQQRIDALTAVDFGKLPLRDAVVWKRGSGKRRLVVFADPNCSYCKHLERDLSTVPDITVYTFLVPVLGGDSPEKSRAIWCSANNGKVWRSWMLDGVSPPAAPAKCDSRVLERNLALSRRHGMVGTPMLVFEDNDRVPGIMTAADITKKLAALGRGRDKG